MQPVTRSCSTGDLPEQERLAQERRTLAASLSSAIEDEPYLRMAVCYTVLYRTADENIDQRFIQANHEQLQLDYAARNTDIGSIPNRPPYNIFAGIGTDTKIMFAPSDPRQITDTSEHVRRVQVTNKEFDGVESCLAKTPPVPGKLNVYIARLASGLLGQALFKTTGNFAVCAVTYASVGSVKAPGAFGAFGLGRTLTHEVGHCLLLEHPFSGCGERRYADVPATRFPNDRAQVNPNSTDGIGAFGCNHYNDLRGLNNPAKSCTGASNSAGEFELFFQYMDYASDANMFVFSRSQAISMHSFVSTIGRRMLTIETLSNTAPVFAEPLVLPSLSPGAFPEIPSSSGIEWAVVGPILIFLAVVIALGFGFKVQANRKKKVAPELIL